tara:strand:+ start:1397 stop:1681 length:285 start_codon:yes stop_codon:yes gene_type:complete
MRYTLSILAILGIFLLPSCASVGAVIEGGKEFTTGVIDGSVNAVATVSGAVLQDAADITATAAEVTSGVVDTVAENVDKQTDELQEKENSPKKD